MKLTFSVTGDDIRECHSKASLILEQIKSRYHPNSFVPAPPEPNYNEYDIPSAPVSANDWQEFKRKFVESIDGEPVQPTGMTHSEFMHYIDSSGWRDGDEYKHVGKNRSARQILQSMDWGDKTDEDDEDPDFKRLFD